MLRIQEVSKERGITLQELAKKMGITYQSLHASINGNPTLERLQQIARILDVDIWDLFDKPSADGCICPNCGVHLRVNFEIKGKPAL